MSSGAESSTATATSTFRAFLDSWLARQQYLLDELLQIQQTTGEEATVDHLVRLVLSHYQSYYNRKTRLANANVFVVFNPPWFSPLEKTYLWASGFKPALMIRVAMTAVNDMTEEQTARLRTLRDRTAVQERSMDENLAKIQESVASPEWVVLFRRQAGPQAGSAQHRPVVGEIDELGDQTEVLKQRLTQLVREADRLRMTTADCVVEILRPYQSAKFFAAFAQLFFRVRARGAQMEADRVQQEQQQHPDFSLVTNGW